MPILLTYGRVDRSVPTELVERGDTVSTRGFGRCANAGCAGLSEDALMLGEEFPEFDMSSFIPSFQAGGEGA